jgi:N-acetylglucosaminyl-diphospho-decaprenol L-rhamnosyltransferase
MVSVVIVNWNSGSFLEHCVASVHEHTPDSEIIIVDNASQDSSLAFAEHCDAPLTLLRNRRNAGFAAACNQGWRAAHRDEILFLNPDAGCLSGGVENLARALVCKPDVWAAGGRLIHPAGTCQAGFNLRAFPTVAAVAAEMLLLDEIWPRNPWTRAYRMSDRDDSVPGDVDQPAAACLMVRRSALESIRGFDEQFYPAWFEDVDLCKRIRAGGGRIVYEPKACFSHQGGVSLRSLTREEFLQAYHANQIRYFQKHHGSQAAARVRRLVIAGLRLRACVAVLSAPLRGRPALSYARACWHSARHHARAQKDPA